jgi:hypothetical protein
MKVFDRSEKTLLGQFFTPIDLVLKCLAVIPKEHILKDTFEPCVGHGAFFFEIIKRKVELGMTWQEAVDTSYANEWSDKVYDEFIQLYGKFCLENKVIAKWDNIYHCDAFKSGLIEYHLDKTIITNPPYGKFINDLFKYWKNVENGYYLMPISQTHKIFKSKELLSKYVKVLNCTVKDLKDFGLKLSDVHLWHYNKNNYEPNYICDYEKHYMAVMKKLCLADIPVTKHEITVYRSLTKNILNKMENSKGFDKQAAYPGCETYPLKLPDNLPGILTSIPGNTDNVITQIETGRKILSTCFRVYDNTNSSRYGVCVSFSPKCFEKYKYLLFSRTFTIAWNQMMTNTGFTHFTCHSVLNNLNKFLSFFDDVNEITESIIQEKFGIEKINFEDYSDYLIQGMKDHYLFKDYINEKTTLRTYAEFEAKMITPLGHRYE